MYIKLKKGEMMITTHSEKMLLVLNTGKKPKIWEYPLNEGR